MLESLFDKTGGLQTATLLNERLRIKCFSVSFVKFSKHLFYRTARGDCFGWLALIEWRKVTKEPWKMFRDQKILRNQRAEVYPKPCKTSVLECFAKIVNGWKLFFIKHFILDVWQGSVYASEKVWIILAPAPFIFNLQKLEKSNHFREKYGKIHFLP